MNTTGTPTYEKHVFSVRLPQEVYNLMADKIHEIQKDCHSYSINQYITDLITDDLRNNSKTDPAPEHT